jgi:succinate dehydrogenase / fumarate reductase, cytochrome b subunit
MSYIKTTLNGYVGYRGREGHLGFLLHRITGLGTVLFLTVHILDTATVYLAPALYTDVIYLYRTTLFGLGEIALVFCVFYHGINGLRIGIFDLFSARNWNIPFERTSVRATLILTLVLWLPATFIMLRNILIHNFGLFGG